MALSEKQLRDRIHLLFCRDIRADNAPQPDFWIPVEEQPGEAVDGFQIAPREGGMEEEVWLKTPNPAFGGKSPNDLLKSGRENDLEKLETAIRAIEEGAFS